MAKKKKKKVTRKPASTVGSEKELGGVAGNLAVQVVGGVIAFGRDKARARKKQSDARRFTEKLTALPRPKKKKKKKKKKS